MKMKLTDRQRDVVAMVGQGKSNKQIAAALGITEGTVKDYLHTVFQRFNVTSRTELALRWSRETEAMFAQEV